MACATASDREAAPNFRYTACACVLTVLADTPNWAAISRNERWLGRKRRILNSAIVREEGPAKLLSARVSMYAQARSNHSEKIFAPDVLRASREASARSVL